MEPGGHHGVHVVEPLDPHNNAIELRRDRRIGGITEVRAARDDSGRKSGFRLGDVGGRVNRAAEPVDRVDPQALALQAIAPPRPFAPGSARSAG